MKKKTVWITTATIAAALVVGAGVGVGGVAVADPFENDRLSGNTLDRASEAALAEVGAGTVTDSERSDDLDHAYEIEVTRDDGDEVDVKLDESFDVVRVDDDDRRDNQSQDSSQDRNDNSGQSASTGPTAVPAPIYIGDADDAPIGVNERTSAEKAALNAAGGGGGIVTELDRSDDRDHAWEVEVTREDGTEIDIELDTTFTVTRVDQ